jgi:hypothetical protein
LEIYHLKILIKKKKKLKASKEIMLLIKLEIYLPLFIQIQKHCASIKLSRQIENFAKHNTKIENGPWKQGFNANVNTNNSLYRKA